MARTARFGRDDDLRELEQALVPGATVAVTGPPGIGKSRVLREVADRWAGEVVWVDLDGAADVRSRVATALGLGAEPNPPIRRALDARPGALLVLDEAESVATELGPLLEDWVGPHLRALVGSRVRIDPPARLHPLGPLALDAARALYLDRARALVPDLQVSPEVLDQVVEALDAIPQALELAAARVRLFPPDAVLRRLPEALGSLRAALDASFALLRPSEQEALARASLFRGPFDAAAFEAVTGSGAEALEVLLDASLVHLDAPGRMRLLGTLRTFAADHLDEPAREDGTRRHASWAVGASETALAQARRGGGWAPVAALRADLAAAARTEPRAALLEVRIAQDLGPVADPGPAPPGVDPIGWAVARASMLGRLSRHEEALAALEAIRPEGADERRVVLTHRLLQLVQLSPAAAEALVPEVEAAAADGPPGEVGEAAIAVAVACAMRGRVEPALAALERGRRAVEGAGELEVEARLLAYLGLLSRPIGFGVAGDHLKRAAELYAALGNERRLAMALAWWGVHAHDTGRNDLARTALERSIALCARCGDALMEAEVRGHAVELALDERRLDDAERLLEELRRSPVRTPLLLARARGREGLLALLRGAPAASALEEAVRDLDGLGKRGLATLHRVYLALALDPERAAVVLGEAAAEAEAVQDGYPLIVTLAREGLAGGLSPTTRALVGEAPGLAARLVLAIVDGGARVASDGAWLEAQRGARIELGSKPVLRRLLAALAAAGPGTALSRGALVSAIWPGERMRADSADGRLHAAVRTLRKLGLRDALFTTEVAGELAYGLAGDVRIEP